MPAGILTTDRLRRLTGKLSEIKALGAAIRDTTREHDTDARAEAIVLLAGEVLDLVLDAS